MSLTRSAFQSRQVSLTASFTLFLLIGVAPVVWMVASTFAGAGPASLLSSLMTGRQWQLLGHTVLLGALVVLLTTLVGTSLGVVLAKTDIPYKGFLYSILMVPLFLPPYLLALSWFYLLGKKGLLASLAGAHFGEFSSSLLFSLSGTVFVLTLSYYPVTMILVHTFVRALNPSFEEAGRLLMAWPRVLTSIDLPLIAPGIFLGALLTFILTISELGVPLFLRYDVFTVQVFTQFAAFYDYKAASLFSLPLLLLIAVLLMVERYTLRDRFFAVVGQRSQRQVVIPLGPLRLPVGGLVLAFMSLAVLLPIGALLITSRSPSFYLEAMRGSGRSIVNSLLDAGLGATLITILGFFLAYLIERSKGGYRHGVDSLLMLLFALPGTVLGIGLILLWNRSGTSFIYGSTLVVLLGYIARYTALAARIQGIAFRQIPKSYEEAARLAQVRWGTEILRIHVPSLKKPLLTSWVIAFIFCLRDLDTTMTVYPPGGETLPVRIYTLMANSPEPVVAALVLILVAITLAALAVMVSLLRGESKRVSDADH